MKPKMRYGLLVLGGVAVIGALLVPRSRLLSQNFPTTVGGEYVVYVRIPSTPPLEFDTLATFTDSGQIITSTGMDFGGGSPGLLKVACPTSLGEVTVGKTRGAGHGVWNRESVHRVSWTILTQRFGDNGVFLGYERLRGMSQLTMDGRIAGTIRSDFFDGTDPLTGTPTCTFTGIQFTARRLGP